MNVNTNANVRGRGGTPLGRSHRSAPRGIPIKPKVSALGGGDFEYSAPSELGGKAFVVVVASAEGHQQFTVHRPIGQTDLADSEWVCTPSSEIQVLLSRKESEEQKRWANLREREIRSRVLRARTGRELTGDGPAEAETFSTSHERASAVRATLEAQCEREGIPKSTWPTKLTGTNAQDEQRFKAALKSTGPGAAWEASYPKPTHVTKSGPLEDRLQEAIPYLSGKSQRAATTYVVRRLYGSSDEDAVNTSGSTSASTRATSPVATGSGA